MTACKNHLRISPHSKQRQRVRVKLRFKLLRKRTQNDAIKQFFFRSKRPALYYANVIRRKSSSRAATRAFKNPQSGGDFFNASSSYPFEKACRHVVHPWTLKKLKAQQGRHFASPHSKYASRSKASMSARSFKSLSHSALARRVASASFWSLLRSLFSEVRTSE